MSKNTRFHIPPDRLLTKAAGLIQTAISNGRITSADAELIREFIAENIATNNISAGRQYKLIGQMISNRDYLAKEYSTCTIADIYEASAAMQNATTPSGGPLYKQNTLRDRIMALKRFSIWLSENSYNNLNYRKLQKIKPPAADHLTITAAELLTEDEVRRIIDACTNSRDRALLSMLYEGAFRIGEIGGLTWGQCKISADNIVINTDEKTGKPRYIPLISTRAYLLAWKNDYPLQISPDAFVFLTWTTHIPLQYQGLVKQIRAITKRAGITKNIHPHIFRHSRITHMLRRRVPEAIIKLLCWGDVGTDMLATYQHLINTDIEDAVFELNGIARPDLDKKQSRGMQPIQCKKCGVVNPAGAAYCFGCGKPLSTAANAEIAELTEELQQLVITDPIAAASVIAKMADNIRAMPAPTSGGSQSP